jgi:hypothetical protein
MIVTFEEAIKKIEDTDLDAFKEIWNAACDSCATIASDSIEYEVAAECREMMVD